MRNCLSYAAAAAILALAGPALAQTPAAKAPSSGQPSPSAAPSDAPPSAAPTTTAPASATQVPGTNAAANVGASTTLTTGMSVKDNTGAIIGEVKALKDGVATIQMGSDTFTVDSAKLGVAGGAATINATQAELRKMLPKK